MPTRLLASSVDVMICEVLSSYPLLYIRQLMQLCESPNTCPNSGIGLSLEQDNRIKKTNRVSLCITCY